MAVSSDARQTEVWVETSRRNSPSRVLRPCMISFYFEPEYSGSSVQAFNLSRQLRALGHAPVIVAANLSGATPFEVRNDIPIYRIPCPRAGEWQVPGFYASVARFLVAHRSDFDVLHAHGTLRHGIVSLMGRLLSLPTLVKIAMADSDIAFQRQGRTWGRLNRTMIRKFDIVIATTPPMVDECLSQGLRSDRIGLIPNGVDTDVFRPPQHDKAALRGALGLPQTPLVTYVGILNPRKNIDGLLRIWRDAVTRGAPGTLVLVGPKSSEAFYCNLMDFIRAEDLERRTVLLGRLDSVVSILQASDVFLFPSKQEGMANAVLEAMACGVPCIVSESAGASALVTHGINGLVAPVADESRFADLLTSLLSDRAKQETLSLASRRTVVDRFSLTVIAKQYVELYASLVRPAGPQSRG